MSVCVDKGLDIEPINYIGFDDVSFVLTCDKRMNKSKMSFDLDIYAFCLCENGKLLNKNDLIYFCNKKNSNCSIKHTGSNFISSLGIYTDENILIRLSELPIYVDKIVLTTSIFNPLVGQNFSIARKAILSLIDSKDKTEICKVELNKSFLTDTALEFCEIFRDGSKWRYKYLGNSYRSFTSIRKKYGC